MIAYFGIENMNESAIVQDNKKIDKKIRDSLLATVNRVLSAREEFRFELSDKKPGNWFLLGFKDEEYSNVIVLSYSIKENNKVTNLVGAFSCSDDGCSPFDVISWPLESRGKEMDAKWARDTVKRFSSCVSMDSLEKAMARERHAILFRSGKYVFT